MPQHGVDGRLISPALATEKAEHIRIEAQGDLLFLAGPANSVRKEVATKFRDLREINLRILERINALPIRSRSLFRIVYFHDGLPFSAK